ncbi:hypothetical protein ACIBLA_36260 [Streptomyces sp. NPDC050433]|uniref:hypothetical protein n=1 Tax=Streptomyces sp. NPDC050433 TaxID=3365615 RepID=UPI003795ACCC
MIAIKRKFVMPALVSAITVTSVASCATGVPERAAEKEATAGAKQVAGPSAEAFAGRNAGQIVREAVTATKGAKSLRLTAEGTEAGRLLKVDFSLDRQGTCAGGLRRDDGEAEFVVVDRVTYVKGDDEFWWSISSGAIEGDGAAESADPDMVGPDMAESLVQLLRGKWLKIPAGGDTTARALGGACDLDAMLGGLNTADAKGVTRGDAAEVDGRKAVTLVKRETDGTRTTFVAAEGPPRLLKAVREGGQDPGTVLFSDYGVPVKATAPPAPEVVDLGDLRDSANPAPGF